MNHMSEHDKKWLRAQNGGDLPLLTISYQQALDALDKATLDKGEDFIYQPEKIGPENLPRCQYFNTGGEVGCIVGHVMSQMGVKPLPADSPMNTVNISSLIASGVIKLVPEPDETYLDYFDWRVYRLLTEVQNVQDSQHPWSVAVAVATTHALTSSDRSAHR